MDLTKNLIAGLFLFVLSVGLSPTIAGDSLSNSSMFREIQLEARNQNKLVLVLFTSETCGSCQWMKSNAFQYPTVKRMINSYYLYQEISLDSLDQIDLKELYGIGQLPATVVFTPDGALLDKSETVLDAIGMSRFLLKCSYAHKQEISRAKTESQIAIPAAENQNTIGMQSSENLEIPRYTLQLAAFSTQEYSENFVQIVEDKIDLDLVITQADIRGIRKVIYGDTENRNSLVSIQLQLEKLGIRSFIQQLAN